MDPMIGREIGGCHIIDLIGQGGMGAVYRAHHNGLDIPVAVKILRPVLPADNEVQRFFREARTAAKLRHPGIIGVLNVGCENGTHFIIMEYIEGGNLLDILRKRKKFSVTETSRIGIEVLSALEVAFNNGIVHRDIKPENILLDKSGNVKLADLGLALISGETKLTQPSMMLGSPLYIAPEQAENSGTVDHRADIYSLGCTLFHMVAGVPPYQGESPVEIILAHIKKPVPELHKTDHSIPSGFSDVICTMMDKKPDKRFRTPREARLALQNAFSTPMKPKTIAASARFYLRLPFPTALIALLALAIISIGGTIFFVVNRNNVPGELKNGNKLTDSAHERTEMVVDNRTIPPGSPSDTNHSTSMTESQNQSTSQRSSVLNTVLLHDVAGLRELLNSGQSPNPMPDDPLSPLHAAVSTGDSTSLGILLSMGANPNVQDSSGDTPLHDAIRSNNVTAVKSLLVRGANPNLKDHDGNKPLQIARKNNEVSSLLRQFGGR